MDILGQEQLVSPSLSTVLSNDPVVKARDTSVESSTTVEAMNVETINDQTKTKEIVPEITVTLNNPCIVCSKQEKRLACIPCGHLVACASCGQTLRTCPICRREIEAFVRIYI